ncbi:hypothetical protein Tco_1397275 [Tanacetum coccineum]
MPELREDTFSGNKNEDSHDYVERVLNIVSLFNIHELSQEAVLLRVFLFTLTGATKRWVDRLTPKAVNTWDLLKKAFIQRYYPPSKTVKQLKDIHNFKQESDNHYTKLGNGPILGMIPTQALTAIQTMANHSQKWHDGTSSKNISSSSDTDGLAVVISKLDNLRCDMKKLKENVHAIQVGCQIYE